MAFAMGGPGRNPRRVGPLLLHLSGATVGGAFAGLVIGLAGYAVGASQHRLLAVGGAALVALVLALRRPGRSIGRRCQVPRRWGRGTVDDRTLFAWGALLGSGLLTAVPFSGFLLLPAMEFTAGAIAAGIAGALFGLVRQLSAAGVMLWGREASKILELDESMHHFGLLLNKLLLAAAVCALGLQMFGAF